MTNEPKASQSLEELSRDIADEINSIRWCKGSFPEFGDTWDVNNQEDMPFRNECQRAILSALRTATQQKDAEISNLREQRELDEHRIDKLTVEVARLKAERLLTAQTALDAADKQINQLTARVKELEDVIYAAEMTIGSDGRVEANVDGDCFVARKDYDKLTAENAELRKDKERLDWLSENTLKCLNLKEPLRDAIDAARNAERTNDQSANKTNSGRTDA